MDRGLDFQEDLYSPGWVDFELNAGEKAWLVATIENIEAPDIYQIRRWETAARDRRASQGSRLDLAADQFLVKRSDGSPTVIAGYPWFTDRVVFPGVSPASEKRFGTQIDRGSRYLDDSDVPDRFSR